MEPQIGNLSELLRLSAVYRKFTGPFVPRVGPKTYAIKVLVFAPPFLDPPPSCLPHFAVQAASPPKTMSQIIPTLLSSTADLITYGLTPLPYLRFSLFDLVGSFRLALVLRQIRESERQRGIQEKQRGVNSKETREIEDGGLVKDMITAWTVVYGGEMVCGTYRSSLLVSYFLHCTLMNLC